MWVNPISSIPLSVGSHTAPLKLSKDWSDRIPTAPMLVPGTKKEIKKGYINFQAVFDRYSNCNVVSFLWIMTSSKEGALKSRLAIFQVCICATEIWSIYDWPTDSLTCLKKTYSQNREAWWHIGILDQNRPPITSNECMLTLQTLKYQRVCFSLID